MKMPAIVYRLIPIVMLWIDLLTPVLIMGVVGFWVDKFALGLGVGFVLGLLSYFRHWSKKDAQPVDFSHLFTKKAPKPEEGDSK